MDLVNRETLRRLAQSEADPCVSIFMPTYHVESELSQNAIRLKNLVKEARQRLKEQGYRDERIDEVLRPAQEFFDGPSSWNGLSDGLALFLTPDAETVSSYRVPLEFDELVVTGKRFHLKPLFPLIASNNRFYVLALSQNRVRLFQGAHYNLSEIESTEIPESLVEALFYDDPERSLQMHTANRAGTRHDGIFHGQGTQDEDQRRRPHDSLRRFFRDVDRGLQETLRDDEAPLLLAGVEYYLPIYREVNSYARLVEDEIIAGSPDHLRPHQLHEKAWEIVEPLFLEVQQTALEEFEQRHQAGGLASTELREIIPAAVYSRVDTLFVPVGEHLWGRYDPESNAVSVHEEYELGDDDLFDFSAVHTYLHGGTVHALRRENMPVPEGLAATFRYPARVEAEEK